MQNAGQFIEEALQARSEQERLRSLRPVEPGRDEVSVERDGRTFINFSCNDYLGLSKHPRLIERSKIYAENYGVGSTASRLISGTYTIHDELEEKIAELFGSEAALVFNSGFQANSSLVGVLADRHSLVLADRLSHNSLLQGSMLSRSDFQRYDHNDMNHLEQQLADAVKADYSRILIITETVFSMDGDRSDLETIVNLAEKYGAMLYVDDAHAVGVWGERGLGLANEYRSIDVTLGTFGKAFGVFGAYVTCTSKMRDYLVNFCPGFIYTTALPPMVIGALDAAVELIPELEPERRRLQDKTAYVRQSIQDIGFSTGKSDTQIIPVIVGKESDTLELSRYLERQGLLATAIRPPTVPEGSSRIRITLSSKHTDEQIEQLLKSLRNWHEEEY